MSHYYTRWCSTHGEWDDDVDNPSDCPECERVGMTSAQQMARRLGFMEARLTALANDQRLPEWARTMAHEAVTYAPTPERAP